MITKEQLLINPDNNPISKKRTISVTLKVQKLANLANNYQCDAHDHAGHAVIEQLKRSVMLEVYSEITQDLTELSTMVGLSQQAMRKAIIDKLDKYTGVIDE